MTETCMLLKVRWLPEGATRGALCRADVHVPETADAVKQPGRERPPSATPDSGPTPTARGVAHARADVSGCPDEMCRRTRRRSDIVPGQSWPHARRAPRLEMVATVTHRFLNGRGRMPVDQAAHAASSS